MGGVSGRNTPLCWPSLAPDLVMCSLMYGGIKLTSPISCILCVTPHQADHLQPPLVLCHVSSLNLMRHFAYHLPHLYMNRLNPLNTCPPLLSLMHVHDMPLIGPIGSNCFILVMLLSSPAPVMDCVVVSIFTTQW